MLLAAMAAAQVTHALCISVNLPDWPGVYRLATAHPNLYATAGVHPDYEDTPEPSVADLVALATRPRVVAVGETGLDYYRLTGDLEWQRNRFRTHIRAAREAGRPLVIHTRAAAADTLAIMREERADEAGGVMHCFTETWDVAQAALDLGFHISFSGIVTFRNARELKDVAAQLPLERMLIETDSPYLAPVPAPRPDQRACVRPPRRRRDRPAARRAGRSDRRGDHAPISSGCSGSIRRGARGRRRAPSTRLDRPTLRPSTTMPLRRRTFVRLARRRAARRRSHARAQDALDDFMIAVANDRAPQVRALLQRGIDPNSVDAAGDPALLIAARAGNVATVDVLLDAKANVDARNRFGDTPLMVAVLQGRVDVAKKLRARGAAVNTPGGRR